jgi:hypothetical protein
MNVLSGKAGLHFCLGIPFQITCQVFVRDIPCSRGDVPSLDDESAMGSSAIRVLDMCNEITHASFSPMAGNTHRIHITDVQ